jgi:hypothetical protein
MTCSQEQTSSDTPAVEDLARTAIEKKQNIEFYYASDEDLKADKLSYRFIARKAP